LLAALTYPFRSSAWQLPALVRYAAGAHRGAPGRLRRIVLELSALIGAHAALLALALALHGLRLGAGVYLLSVGLPALFAPWSMMLTNYLQHVGCEPGSQHNHSRNFVSPFWNWFVFDNGYHTAHHEQPGLHWSLYRALHQSRAARIDPRLNQRTPLAYCLEAYLLPLIGARRPRGGSAGMPAARSAQAPLPLSRPGAGRTLQAAPELAGK
jgi:fatty acid desaturase